MPERWVIFEFSANETDTKRREIFGLTVNQVYVSKHRVTQLIKDEAARLEKHMT